MKKLLLQLLALLLAGPAFLLACGFGLPAQYDESCVGLAALFFFYHFGPC